MLSNLLLLTLGGALGAVCRFWISLVWSKRKPTFPYPTLTVNLIGSAILGGLFGMLDPDITAIIDAPILLFAGVGFCGAFTTFSSFCTETIGLVMDSPGRALLYVFLTVGGSLLAFSIPFLAL